MAAKAGEKAQKTGDFYCASCSFYCASCSEKVHVQQGNTIPQCPNGHKAYEARHGEPGNKS